MPYHACGIKPQILTLDTLIEMNREDYKITEQSLTHFLCLCKSAMPDNS